MQGGRIYGSGGLGESRRFPKGVEDLSPSEDIPARTHQNSRGHMLRQQCQTPALVPAELLWGKGLLLIQTHSACFEFFTCPTCWGPSTASHCPRLLVCPGRKEGRGDKGTLGWIHRAGCATPAMGKARPSGDIPH